MAVSYKKLWRLLIDKDMKQSVLGRKAKTTLYALSKLTQGKDAPQSRGHRQDVRGARLHDRRHHGVRAGTGGGACLRLLIGLEPVTNFASAPLFIHIFD